MARDDRRGKRKTREERSKRRVPEMGYYLVVTDTEATERLYFHGLHESLPAEVRKKLVIQVVETKTQKLVEKCKEFVMYDPQYRIPWIVFDRDKVVDFDGIIRKAEAEGFHVGWSNPCFEIWLFGYFGNIPTIEQSWTCCDRFGELYERKTGQAYDKADEKLYHRLCQYGDEEDAIKRAHLKYEQMLRDKKTLPSQMCPCNTVYRLVQEIRKKAENCNNKLNIDN